VVLEEEASTEEEPLSITMILEFEEVLIIQATLYLIKLKYMI
jgi:hypothetical protein